MSDVNSKWLKGVSFPARGVRWYWPASMCLFLLAACCVPFDLELAKLFHFNNLRGDMLRILILSEMFAHGFGVVIVIVGIGLMVREKRRYLPRLALCAFFPAGAAQLIKLFSGRIRPHEFDGQLPSQIAATWTGWLPGNGSMGLNLHDATQSLPSAHTATAIGFAIGLSWLFPRGRFLFFPLAILASLQRLVFEAHWTSDVLFGAALAVMMAGALTHNWGLGYFCKLIETRGMKRLVADRVLLSETEDFDDDWPSNLQFDQAFDETESQHASRVA